MSTENAATEAAQASQSFKAGWRSNLESIRATGDTPANVTSIDSSVDNDSHEEGRESLSSMLERVRSEEDPSVQQAQGEQEAGEGDPQELVDGDSVDHELDSEDGESIDHIETITVGDREITVDWNDREKIKKVFGKAVAYREERRAKEVALANFEEEKQSHEATKGEVERLGGILSKIEQAKEIGPEAAIKLLFGKDLADFQEEWAEREGWSDDRKQAYAESLRVKKLEGEMAAMKAAVEREKEEALRLKEEATRKSIQNHFDASYRKYSLEGSLGDADLEDDLDDRLYEKVKAKFHGSKLEEISPADIDQYFKDERARLLKVYSNSSSKQVSNSIEKKKVEALSTAQAKGGTKAPRKSAQERFKAATSKVKGWRDIISNPDLLKQL